MPAPSTRALLLLVTALVAAGCIGARHGVEGDIVRAVRFEGNGGVLSGQTDYQLAAQMEQGDTPWGLLVPGLSLLVHPVAFDERALLRDAYRLEVWYAHNGWFDARVEGWRIEEVRRLHLSRRERTLRERAAGEGPEAEAARATLESDATRLLRRRRARVVDVIGYVQPGEPSFLRKFPWEGLDRSSATLVRTVRRTGELKEGYQFNLVYLDLTRNRLLDRLRDHSYAYATVDSSVDAYPTEHAVDATFTVHQYLSAEFGPIAVRGNEHVPEQVIRETLHFEEGDSYKISTLRDAQRRLFALGTFSVVAVKPDLGDPTREAVPVDVQVVESRAGTWRGGAGASLNGSTFVPRVTTTLRHVNLFNHLVRFEVGASGGASIDLSAGAANALFPIYEGHLQATHPRLFSPRFELSGLVRIEQDLQGGELPYRNPAANLSLAWKLSDEATLKLGTGFQQYYYLQLTGDALLAARATFGESFRNPYQLATVDLRFTWDSRDDPLFTSRGTRFEAGVRQAVPVLVGDYTYTDLSVDWRRFFSMNFGQRAEPSFAEKLRDALFDERVVAVRAYGRVLQPWGASDLPYPELAFLGGDSSLRGFLRSQVGPYDCLCEYPTADAAPNYRYLAVGGAFVAGGSIEVKHPFPVDIDGASLVAPFVDVGLLAPRWQDVSLPAVRWGVGFGARYKTIVGPVRFDLAFRPLYPEDRGPRQVIGCNAGDALGRPIDWFSNRTNRGDPAQRRMPIAVVGYLAISEAF